MIRSVLVAVDGSEPGGRALDLAGGIAARCGAALTLLHVQAHPAHGGVPKDLEDYARIEHVEPTETQMIREVGEELLRRAEARAREAGAGTVSTALEVGDPASAIAEYAKANAIDLDRDGPARPWHPRRTPARQRLAQGGAGGAVRVHDGPVA